MGHIVCREPWTILVLALTMFLMATGCSSGSPREMDGVPDQGADVDAIGTDLSIGKIGKHGVCSSLGALASSERIAQLGAIEPLAGMMLREDFRWREIEKTKGVFDWASTDALVADVRAAGFDIMPLLLAAPEWAGGWSHGAGASPPADPADFAAFVAAVVGRYRGKIGHYQLLNEPNTPRFWGGLVANADEYVTLLKAGYDAGKAADPNAIFVMGGLTNLLDDKQFVADVLTGGAMDACDVLAFHYYPKDAQQLVQRLGNLLIWLEQMGIKERIWITEIGFPSKAVDLIAYFAWLEERGISAKTATESVVLRLVIGHVYDFTESEMALAQDPQALEQELVDLGITMQELEAALASMVLELQTEQAEILETLMDYVGSTDAIEHAFWYRLRDRIDADIKEANMGLIDFDGNRKKSFSVLSSPESDPDG